MLKKSTISQDEIVNIVASLSNVFSFVFILVIIISILSVYLSLNLDYLTTFYKNIIILD